MTDLFKKYDVPAPRYTSYPTVPYWTDSPSTAEWLESLNRAFAKPAPWSLYLHIPFCETLCTFCGCNTVITKNHGKEPDYKDRLLKEFLLYKNQVHGLAKSPLKHVHLGGGTPTFLSAENLNVLLSELFKHCMISSDDFEGSVEVDPRRTNKDQLSVLKKLGFDRLSLGVQDFNPEVQRIVNRVQPYEMTQKITDEARDLGYRSVNFDLIYGLPKQTLESIREMTEKTLKLRPDRIALYSFALVPWIKPQQRLFKDEDVPFGEEKRAFYELARGMLLDGGYIEIGMDHFALPTDLLAVAQSKHTLHRNFMGYTDQKTDVLLGIGVSSISETPDCFHQNEKVLPVYERHIDKGEIPTLRGHKLSVLDRQQRQLILQLMTQFEVTLPTDDQAQDLRGYLSSMIEDHLITLEGRKLSVLKEGRPFLRNACMGLDQRLREKQPGSKVFSQSL